MLVKFDNEQVGMQARLSSQYHSRYPNAVPLSKVEVEITRLQFPLTLA